MTENLLKISPTAPSFSSPTNTYRANAIKPWHLFAVVVIAFALFGTSLGSTLAGMLGLDSKPGTNPGGTVTTTTSQACQQGTAQQLRFNAGPYGGDAALSSPVANVYSLNNNQLLLLGENPGSLSSGAVTTGGAYSLTSGMVAEFTASTSYNLWYPLNGQNFAGQGFNQVTFQCIPSTSNSAANLWYMFGTPIQAPASGTSATTNARTTCINSNGNAMTGAVLFPTSSTLITCYLQILQAYKGAGYSVTAYGTQQNPLTNYATGQVTYSGPVTSGLVAIISSNRTGISVTLDPSAAPGLTLTPVTGNTLVANSKAWVVSGFTGCPPAPGSAGSGSPYNCITLPLQMYETVSQGTAHVDINVLFVDNQQASYILSNLVDAAVASFPAQGSAAGIPTGFTVLTPTTGTNSGAQASLIRQGFTIINTY